MEKIYIVHDELDQRQKYYEWLKAEQFEITTISRSQELFNILKSDRPSLILLSAGGDLEETKKILEGLPKRKSDRIPVLVLTDKIDANLEKTVIKLGALDVVSHSLSREEMLQKIRKILGGGNRILQRTERWADEKIMIVDDDDQVRKFLTLFFDRKGFQTIAAKSGEEAIDLIKESRPTMVLLDVTMPGMDGLITLKKIKEIDPTIGVVMATGIQDETIAKQATELGAYGYVMKPFDLQYLDLVVTTRLLMSV